MMDEASTSSAGEQTNEEKHVFLEQDRFLPIANIARLMKNVIPSAGKIAKDAKECVQESVSEFISFLTSEASERCFNERRKTITGDDLIAALSTLGFDAYVGPLTTYLRKYRDATRSERSLMNFYPNAGNINIAPTPGPTIKPPEQPDTTVVVPDDTTEAVNEPTFAVPQPLIAENLPPLQLLMDPETGQHYLPVQDSDGKQKLVPVVVAESSAVMPTTTMDL